MYYNCTKYKVTTKTSIILVLVYYVYWFIVITSQRLDKKASVLKNDKNIKYNICDIITKSNDRTKNVLNRTINLCLCVW